VKTAGKAAPPRRGVTARALILGLLLTPANVFFLASFSWMHWDFTGYHSVFHNTVAFLFLLALLNMLLKRWRPDWAFAPGEMLTLYTMLGISTGLVAVVWDVGGALAGTITYPFWFATPSNGWETIMWPHLPAWLTVQEQTVLDGFFSGRSTGYTWPVLRAWAGPALWWATFVGALMWVCLCLNAIVRRRWEDEQKLPYPLVQLPVQLAEERFGLLRSKLFWLAVSLCFAIELLNIANQFIPSVPTIPQEWRFFQTFANRRPWNMIPYPIIRVWPWFFGLAYLVPLDLTFSMFAFGVLWNAEYVLAGSLGWASSRGSPFPYGYHQSAGGYLAIVAAFLWLDRRYFVLVLKKALGLRSPLQDDGREAFSYRFAVLGGLAGCAYVWWFLDRAGMYSWLILTFLVLYFVIALSLSRLRAQLGAPAHTLPGMMPDSILRALVGTRALGPRANGLFYLMSPYLNQQDNNPTPIQLEAFKMAEGGRMQRRRIAIAMALVAPLSIVSFVWANIHFGYQLGFATGDSNIELLQSVRYPVADLDAALRSPMGPNTSATLAMGVGFIMTLALMALKLRFTWWPLHPVAFPLVLGWMIMEMMVPLFAVWLFKLILFRYGGIRGHRTALPFFLGLLVGGLTAQGLARWVEKHVGIVWG